MGLFYTNYALYGIDQKQVTTLINKLKRTGYVSPTVDQFNIYYDKESEDQDPNIIKKLAESFSNHFHCSVLASVVHDSDIFLYWLYNSGKLIDTYNSIPDYFESTDEKSAPEGGDAEKLCSAFGNLKAVENLKQIFNDVEQSSLDEDWSGEYLQGEDIHLKIAEVLGMPSFAANIGFYTIENGEIPEELNRDDLIKCAG